MRKLFTILWTVAGVGIAMPIGWQIVLGLRNRKACPHGWVCDYFTPAWMNTSKTIGFTLLFLLAACEASIEMKRLWARYRSDESHGSKI